MRENTTSLRVFGGSYTYTSDTYDYILLRIITHTYIEYKCCLNKHIYLAESY